MISLPNNDVHKKGIELKRVVSVTADGVPAHSFIFLEEDTVIVIDITSRLNKLNLKLLDNSVK